MFDEGQLRALSPAEREQLRQALAALDSGDSASRGPVNHGPAGHGPVSHGPAGHGPVDHGAGDHGPVNHGAGDRGPGYAADPVRRRRRALVLTFLAGCCVVLAAWTGLLAVTLPRYYRAGGWRGAWVGFDVALLIVFAVTGWAAWRRRQLLIVCLIVLATLLCCDAWFDVVLDARTPGFELSLLSAIFVELPLAACAIIGARRLLKASVALIRRYEGAPGPLPRLRQLPLIGAQPGPLLSDAFSNPDHVAARPALADQASPDQAATDLASPDTAADGLGNAADGPADGQITADQPEPGYPEAGYPEAGY